MKILFTVIKNKLYGLVNFLLLGIPEDYYRMEFFSRKYKPELYKLYTEKLLYNFYKPTIFSEFRSTN